MNDTRGSEVVDIECVGFGGWICSDGDGDGGRKEETSESEIHGAGS